jgi:hypothetical protein
MIVFSLNMAHKGVFRTEESECVDHPMLHASERRCFTITTAADPSTLAVAGAGARFGAMVATSSTSHTLNCCEKQPFLFSFPANNDDLPRQARDKHEKTNRLSVLPRLMSSATMAPRISPRDTHTQHSKTHSMLSDCCVLVETAVIHISQQQYADFKWKRNEDEICWCLMWDRPTGRFP